MLSAFMLLGHSSTVHRLYTERPLGAGTRISVDGHGEGVYQAWTRNMVGANTHTIHFDAGGRQEIQLKPLAGHWRAL